MDTNYTKKELTCLLRMRRKPRTWAYLATLTGCDEKDMSIMLSRIRDLFYVKDDQPIMTGLLVLNQLGHTVAQAEFDRRFDMYLTRVTALAGLFVSIAALVISLIVL